MNQSSASPRRIFAVSGILSLVLICATISPAQQQAAPSTQETQKATVNDEGIAPLPLSPVEKAQKDGTALPLSLRDVTKMALQNNLDIAIQDTNEQLSQEKIRQAYGDYDPKLTGQLGLSRQKSAITSYTSSSATGYNQNDSAQWNFTFTQAVKTGGTLTAQWNSTRSDNNSYIQSFNPQYSGQASVSFTQPLLKNFSIDSTRSNIKLVNLDLRNTDSTFRQKVTETIANIQTQYWALVSAVRDYDIKRRSLKSALIQLRDNRKKVDVGTLAPIDVVDAEATASTREVELIASEETILTQENALRTLISNNRKSEIWSQVIVPTDTPEFIDYKVELQSAIDTALQNRPEMVQSDITLNRYDINKKLAVNNRKWQVDLVGSFGSNGVSGPQSYRRNGLTGQLELDQFGNKIPNTPEALVGGVGNAYKTIFTEGYTNWSVRLQLTIPLRNRTVDAQIAQYDIQKRQELMKRKQTEQSIQVDVQNAIQKIETRKKQVQTASQAKKFAEERLAGEEKRFNAGLTEGYLVLQRQNEVASSEYQELQALINYKRAIVDLQKAMYTLLESNDFEIAKSISGKDAPDLK